MDTLTKIFALARPHLLAIIIGLALFLRLYNLAGLPPALNWDEVSMGYSAYSLLQTGADEWGVKYPLLFRSYGEWKSPVYIYLLMPFVQVFGLNAWGVRLPAALAGVIAVYLTYLIANRLYGHRVGLIAAFLLTVSPWHLMLSRPAFEAGLALTLVLLGIYLLLQKKFLWAVIPLGISLHTYHSAKIVVPFLFLYMSYSFFRQIGIKKLLVSALILGIFALPIATDLLSGRSQKRFAQVGITTDTELVERFYKYRDTFPLNDLGDKLVFNKYTFLLTKGFSNWTSYLSPHFLLGSDSIRAQHSIPFRGVLYLSEFALVIMGLYYLFRQQSGIGRTLPILMIAVAFIPPALTKDAYHVLRSILTLPWWQIIAAIGLVSIQQSLKKHWLLTSIYCLLALEILVFIMLYFAWYPQAFARDWQYGYKEVVEYISNNDEDIDKVIFTKTYGEPQIFVAFYSRLDPRIYQAESRNWLTYEDQGFPWLDQLPSYTLGKFIFEDIRYMGTPRDSGVVYVGKQSDFWDDTHVLQKIDFPDKTNAFVIVDGQ